MTYKILIVDDSKLARMAAIKALSKTYPDLKRVEAGSAADALALMERDAPDIALVDFNMPDRDGLALVADLRNLSPEMPIAVISANHQQEVIDRSNALRATFLPKPLAENALLDFLKVALAELDGTAR